MGEQAEGVGGQELLVKGGQNAGQVTIPNSNLCATSVTCIFCKLGKARRYLGTGVTSTLEQREIFLEFGNFLRVMHLRR